jgi:hypothetical protein
MFLPVHEFRSERYPQLGARLTSEYDYVLSLRIEIPRSLPQGASINWISFEHKPEIQLTRKKSN